MFTVIGERINTTLKKVQAAVVAGDADYIKEDVKKPAVGRFFFWLIHGILKI